jgi:TonB family protein
MDVSTRYGEIQFRPGADSRRPLLRIQWRSVIELERMSEMGKRWEGQIVNGEFPLLRYLGTFEHSSVFLTERKQEPTRESTKLAIRTKLAIKLIPALGVDAEPRLLAWEAAAQFSHPHVIRLFQAGRCKIDSEDYLYVVMEYADEDLSEVLPIRSLTAEEAREMLLPVLDALRYIHSKGFVHRHIKPANIVAVGDQLKISSDGIVRADGGTGALHKVVNGKPCPYDPPEASTAGFTRAGDVWSLGITLVEGLTQRLPVQESAVGDFQLPDLPTPFAEIARHCLRRDPKERWSLDEIAAHLTSTAPSEKAEIAKAEIVDPNRHASAKRGWLIAAVVLGLVLVAVVAKFTPKYHSPEARQSAPGSAPAQLPSAEVPQSNAPSGVVQQVLPDVSRGSRNTIHGTIRVKVRLAVDPSGNVLNATLVSPGPSKYFANLAWQAARKWKFTPGASNEWLLTFEFRQSGTRATANPAERQTRN